jgi:hypothetical protein
LVLSTSPTGGPGPSVGSLDTTKGPQTNGKRFDGKANTAENAQSHGKK